MLRHSFRDREAVDRLVSRVRGLPAARAKQLCIPGSHRRALRCPACGKSHKAADPSPCDGCGSFLCKTCDEFTSGNGGHAGQCFECLVTGRAQSAE